MLWLQIPDAPRVIKGDAAGEIETTADWTEATREAFADRVEDILRQSIRNFDAIKLARRAYSPADLAGLNVNLVGGDLYGGACTRVMMHPFEGRHMTLGSATCGAELVRGSASRDRPLRRSCGRGRVNQRHGRGNQTGEAGRNCDRCGTFRG